MDLGGAAAGGVPCGTLSFFGLPAAGCVLCGPFLSLGFLLAVLLEDNFCGSGRCCCWWFSVWDTFFLWASCCWLCSVWTLSLSGLPAGCSLGGHLLWIWAVLLLVVFRVGHFLSLGFLLLAVFCVDPFSLWASCWLFSRRTTSVDLGGAAAGGFPCGTLSLGFLLLVVFLVDTLSLWASCCWLCSVWASVSLWAPCCWLCSVWAPSSLWASSWLFS